MASARTLSFVFELIDKFTPMAAQLARAAKSAERTLAGMGRASNAVEHSQRGAANAIAAMNQRAIQANPALKNATDRLRAYGAAGERAAQQVRTLEQAHRRLAELEKSASLSRAYGGGPMTRADYRDRAIGHAGGAMMAAYVSDSLSRAVSHFLTDANHEFFNKQKMGFVGFKGDLLKEADHVAEVMSKKYKNLSKGDVLEQLYDGVSIHGDAAHALHYVENQTKLASFLQAFQDGKHGGRSKEWNREVFAAIKSMEMYGVLNKTDEAAKGRDIEAYLGSMMSMKALYGDNAKLTEYLTLQRRAGTSFRMFDENFRLNVLPALVQEVGGATTGQQAMTAYQSIVAGVKITQKQMDMMATYGLLDKKGKRFTREAGDLYASDPTLFAADLKERAAKKFKMGIDDERLIPLLRRDISSLFPNRNAASFIDNLLANSVNIHKHVEAMKAARKEMAAIAAGEFFAAKTKAGAEGSVAAQWSNMIAAFGGPMMQPYIDRMNAWAKSLNWVSQSINSFSKANPALAGMIGKGAIIGAGTLATLAMAASVGFGLAALRAGIGYLFAAGGSGGAGALGRSMGMAGAGMAGGAVPMAAMIAAPMVAAKGVGLLTRALAGVGLIGSLALRGLVGFHLGVNGLGAGLAFLGRVWRTTWVGMAMVGGGTMLWKFREELKAAGAEVMKLANDVRDLWKATFENKRGSEQSKKKLKQLIDDVVGDSPSNLSAMPHGLFDKAKLAWMNKEEGMTGNASYWRWWDDTDKWRLPFGDQSRYGLNAISYYDADLLDIARQSAKSGNFTNSPAADAVTGPRASAAYMMNSPESIPQSFAQSEIAVRSMVDVNIPPSINVQVSGVLSGSVTNLQGSVTGSGTAGISAHPRGESSPVTKLPNGLSRTY